MYMDRSLLLQTPILAPGRQIPLRDQQFSFISIRTENNKVLHPGPMKAGVTLSRFCLLPHTSSPRSETHTAKAHSKLTTCTTESTTMGTQ